MNTVLASRMDFVDYEGRTYLVTLQSDGLCLWDFKAWVEGAYDAYIPMDDIDRSRCRIVGTFGENPELLPKECEGYNGEIHGQIVQTIWINPKFRDRSID